MRSSTVQKHEGQISNFSFLISTFRERLHFGIVICFELLSSSDALRTVAKQNWNAATIRI